MCLIGFGCLLTITTVNANEIAQKIEQPGFGFIRADVSPDVENVESFPSQATPIQGGSFEMALKIPHTHVSNREVAVALHFGRRERSEEQHHISIGSVMNSTAPVGTMAARFWAQKKLEHLQAGGDESKPAMLQLGREYGLVTPDTSLIVLETLDQYLKHRVVPPKSSLPEIYEQYMDIVSKEEKKETDSMEERKQRVSKVWKRRVAWLDTIYVDANQKQEPILHQMELLEHVRHVAVEEERKRAFYNK